MHGLTLALIIVVVIAVLVNVLKPFFLRTYSVKKLRLMTFAAILILIGCAGIIGSALSAFGFLNWLPEIIEWPVGYASGVVSTIEGLRIVPHWPSGRIQVYQKDWSFVRWWHVDAEGGDFKLLESKDDRVDVITERGQMHYIYDIKGNLVSSASYLPKSYKSFLNVGTNEVVPTNPLHLIFASPLIAWVVVALGSFLGYCAKKRHAPTTERTTTQAPV